jgi:hypothetical protein
MRFGRGEERAIAMAAAWLGGAAALAVGLVRGPAVGVALGLGAGLSLVNYSWLVAGAYALLPASGEPPAGGGGVARFLGRFALLAGVVCAIFISHLLPVLPVLLGLFAVPAATIGVGVRLAWAHR